MGGLLHLIQDETTPQSVHTLRLLMGGLLHSVQR